MACCSFRLYLVFHINRSDNVRFVKTGWNSIKFILKSCDLGLSGELV